jgi:hypothetical protein
MHFIVWAPGFKPNIHSVSNINPGDELDLTAILKQLPDRTRMEKILNEYDKTLKFIPNAIKPGVFSGLIASMYKIDKSLLRSVIQTLQEWIKDETLPSYFRWNAYDLLRGISGFLSSDKGLEQEVKTILTQIQEKAQSLTPCLADGPTNPWRLQGRYENLLYSKFTRLEAGKVYSDYSYKALAPTPKIVGEAIDLLSKFEVIDPKIPELDNLRAVIALAKGERGHALSLSRYLNHYHFFTLFYGVNVIGPRY